MTQSQTRAMWVVGTVLAGALVYVGFRTTEPELIPPRAISITVLMVEDAADRRASKEAERHRTAENYRRRAEAAKTNQYVGVLGPVLVLGGCVLVTVFARR